jgi:hypothetical protein
MPTQDDLYGAFALLEARAPVSCDIPLPVPARTRLHRFVLPAAAAATVTAVAVGVPAALSHSPAHRSGTLTPPTHTSAPATTPSSRPAGFTQGIPAPTGATRLRLSFTVDQTAGYVVRGDEVNRTYQHATIYPVGATSGDLYLFYRGGYVPSDALHGRRVDVNGRPGYLGTAYPPYSDGTHDDAAGTPSDDAVPLASITWQYAPRSWALLSLDTAQRASTRLDDQLLKLARAVRPGRQELAVPFRLRYLPPGLTADGAIQADDPMYANSIGLADGRAGTPGTVSRIAPPGYDGPALSVAVFKAVSAPRKPFPYCSVDDGYADRATPFPVPAGAGCAYYKHGAVTWIAVRQGGNGSYGMTVKVDPNHYGRYSEAQLREIVDGMVLAPKLDDPATWFDATTAVPR